MAKEFPVLFGMVKTPTKSWSMKQYHGFNILPQVVKEKLPLLAFSNYDSKLMKLELSHEGMKEIKEIWFFYYKICQKQTDGIMLIHQDKLPEKSKG